MNRQSEEDIAEEHNDSMPMHPIRHLPHCYVNKSSSMPNLKTILSNQLQISDAISNSTVSFRVFRVPPDDDDRCLSMVFCNFS